MRHNRGMVLIMVLIFLQILALLELYTVALLTTQEKTNHADWQKGAAIYLTEKILQRTEQALTEHLPACVITSLPVEFPRVTTSWWQAHGCAGVLHKMHYYFIVEPLGSDPCADVGNHRMANFFNITVVGWVAMAKVYLQSVIILPLADELTSCQRTMHRVRMGRQMWRMI